MAFLNSSFALTVSPFSYRFFPLLKNFAFFSSGLPQVINEREKKIKSMDFNVFFIFFRLFLVGIVEIVEMVVIFGP